MCTTKEAAELMLKTGKYFSAATLGESLGITAKKASGLIYNIRMSKLYETEETKLPNRLVKVVSIDGRKTCEQELWKLALGQRSKVKESN